MISRIQPVPSEAGSNRLAAIILAAGYSARMVEFKPLLPIAGCSAFEHCIHLFQSAGVDEIIAVLGHRADELRPLAERAGVRSIINPHFDRGMYSSIVAGSRTLSASVEAAFVLPADIPLVRPATVRQLAASWATRRCGIVYPEFDSRRGHPPLVSHSILAQGADGEGSGPLSSLLARHEGAAIEQFVVDEAIHRDMDTPSEYNALLSLAGHRDVPTARECEAVLIQWRLDTRIIRHSRKVAEVALRIAGALLCGGLSLNLDWVQAGALLHDLAKGKSDHAAAGASILRSMQFPHIAEIVAAHTDLGTVGDLDEKSIVYLADKLVRGEDLVSPRERFQPALDRFKHDKAALQAVRRRLAAAEHLVLIIEARLGIPLSAVLSANAPISAENHCHPAAHEAVAI